MDETPVRVEKRAGYRVVTLNRPQRLNAFTEDMHRALKAALDEAEADRDCRALLLTGAGRGFCAGQDLNDRLVKPGETIMLSATLEQYYNPLIRKLRALPFPVVAAVNGVAAGAGANIALACDIVLAAKSANFVQAFAKIGLVPDSGGSWFLPRLLGSARARARVACRTGQRRESRELGTDLEKRCRRGPDGRGGKALRPVRRRPDLRLFADQARPRCIGNQRSVDPARP